MEPTKLRPERVTLSRPGSASFIVRVPEVLADVEKTWIELSLADDAGKPMAGEEYWVNLPGPDGRPGQEIRKGYLNDQGLARIENLRPGKCRIRFPKYAEDEWEPATDDPEKSASMHLELIDASGRALPDEPYELHFPNGEVVEGKLDANGKNTKDGLYPGLCLVKFPNLNAEDYTHTMRSML